LPAVAASAAATAFTAPNAAAAACYAFSATTVAAVAAIASTVAAFAVAAARAAARLHVPRQLPPSEHADAAGDVGRLLRRRRTGRGVVGLSVRI
jgi:hypothetical protein